MAQKSYRSEIGGARIVVAGLSGDSGKTLVSLALVVALRERGVEVRAFKKGPDYIDAAWLSWASGRPARNLDTWLAGFPAVGEGFARHAVRDGVNVIEGNRGLFDGVDAEGTHSTAALADALGAPVILVVDAHKATRTLAALVLGCRSLQPDLEVAGVVLNRVAGERHRSLAAKAIESASGVPVVGAIPRLEGDLMPGRHLGLVTPEEHPSIDDVRRLALEAARHLDVGRIAEIARTRARPLGAWPAQPAEAAAPRATGGSDGNGGPRIAYLRDAAFSFYYPENLEALEEAGAELVRVSSLADDRLPAVIDALYIGGGFPETHAPRIAENRALLDSIGRAAAQGLPIYAECGGLMLLSRALSHDGRRYAMAGVLPIDVEMCRRPQGHGYASLVVDRPNPFFPIGTQLQGHEFHYSRIAGETDLREATACAVERGTGCGCGRDGMVAGNAWGAYTHLHGGATPGWARAVVRAAQRYRAGMAGVVAAATPGDGGD